MYIDVMFKPAAVLDNQFETSFFSSSPAVATLSGSSLVGSTTIATTTIATTANAAYEITQLKGVGIEEYEMVNEPPETLSPPAQPVTTVGTKGQGVYEDISAPVATQ